MKTKRPETLRDRWAYFWKYRLPMYMWDTSAGTIVFCWAVLIAAFGLVMLIVWAVGLLRPAGGENPSAEVPGEGVGRSPAVIRYLGAPEAEEIGTADRIVTYTEGDGPAPAWYRPDEPMSAEWRESYRQVAGKLDEAEPHPPVGIDAGGIDWNLCTDLEGWDGHRMEIWEMDLYSRIVYLEFWGTSPECCEAGADSILRLWESGYYGPRISDTLTARAEDGSLVYSPYAYVWDWDYDPEGLADMRALCEDRFYNGPEWSAPFFRLNYYHDWAVPMYEIDNVYFSTGWGWE